MFIVYGGEKCSYCTKAKMLLDMREKEYQYFDIYDRVKGDESLTYRDELFNIMTFQGLPLPRSIPQIFIETEEELQYIGGFDKLEEYLGE